MFKEDKNMKKTVFIILIVGSILGLSGCGNDEKEFGVCTTEQDAMNMMIASQVHSSKLQKDTFATTKVYQNAYDINKRRKLKSSEEDKKVEVLRQKMNEASSLWAQYTEDISPITRDINAKEYQKACDLYIETAKKYDFDLKSASKTTITMDELGDNDVKKGGE